MVIVNDTQTEKLIKEVIFLYKIHFLLNNLRNYNLKEKKSINESDKKKDQNKLIKYFEQLKEIYSSDDIDNSNIILKIKTLNGFETNDFVMLRLYGLEGKSKQKGSTTPTFKKLYLFKASAYILCICPAH